MSYDAVAFAVIGSIYFLFKIADTVQIYYFNVNVAKHLISLVGMWLILPLVNIAIKIDESSAYGLETTLAGLYNALMWVFFFITAMYVVGFLYQVFMVMGGNEKLEKRQD